MSARPAYPTVPRWSPFERSFYSQSEYGNPIQDARLQVEFVAPSGRPHLVDGYWDGDLTWRVRFAPDERGGWTYRSRCSDRGNAGLHERIGSFECSEESHQTSFETHGMLVLSPDGSHLTHADGKPYFLLADTAWNGPLKATSEEWASYLETRRHQGFTAVLWASTQRMDSSHGNVDGMLAYSGRDKIHIEPRFFQRLDSCARLVHRSGLLSAPVLLWATDEVDQSTNTDGTTIDVLPEDQAILLGRYMVARWGAFPVIWILGGDGNYQGEHAARWQRIGRAIFTSRPHAPVILHPKSFHLPNVEFAEEEWLDLWGYRTYGRTDSAAFDWLLAGPPSQVWQQPPTKPIINLEPARERRLDPPLSERIGTDEELRPWLYWSALVAPPAGLTYSASSVWRWDDGSAESHSDGHQGAVRDWRSALHLPGARQVAQLVGLLTMMEWWRLRPSPDLVVSQPGMSDRRRTILAACSEAGDLALIYVPCDRFVILNLTRLKPALSAFWFCPRTGARLPAESPANSHLSEFMTPSDGDWVLVFMDVISIPARQA